MNRYAMILDDQKQFPKTAVSKLMNDFSGIDL